jgi:hypothetical protein
MFVVYEPAIARSHPHSVILWKQSPGVYAAFGKTAKIKALEPGATNLKKYAREPVHAWRTYLARGTDSAIDPETGEPIGAFADRLVKLTEQPPDKINGGNPYVFGTLTITALEPTITSSCGPSNLIENVKIEDDPLDTIRTTKLITR